MDQSSSQALFHSQSSQAPSTPTLLEESSMLPMSGHSDPLISLPIAGELDQIDQCLSEIEDHVMALLEDDSPNLKDVVPILKRCAAFLEDLSNRESSMQ